MAEALEIEVYQLFFEGEGKPEPAPAGAMEALDRTERELLALFRQAYEADRRVIFHVARKVAKKEA